MKRNQLLFVIIVYVCLTSFNKPKEFPSINYKTIDGKTITTDDFRDKRTLVIMAHLGCPPAMLLLKDLQSLAAEKFQTIVILENTAQQVIDFNSDKENDWSVIRNHFDLQPIALNVIAECENANIHGVEGNIVIDSQCRKLAKKIKTRDSPTLVFVDEKGVITKIIKGYFGDKERDDRLRKLIEVQ